MINVKKSLEKFNNLPEAIILEVDSDKVSLKMKKLEDKYKINLSLLIIVVVVGDLKMEDIEKYLRIEFNLNKDKAKNIYEDLIKEIFNPLTERLNFLNSDFQNNVITLDKAKNIALDMFKENLVNEMYGNLIIAELVNSRIFYILSRDLNFKKELEKALYKNLEKLTHKEFILDGKPRTPSIKNWLVDFIKHNGAGMFDNLALSQYIINSSNAKKLDDDGKKLLKKLLMLYRNLKFFPESMPSDDGSSWEIIPVEDKEELSKARTVSKPVIDKIDKKESEVDELKKMLENYPEGSLERKAINEEIAKVNHEL
ncbi:MAG: hypothetical protein ABIA02_03355 [Candidatus Falkowbacteria bacterium]